jgi:hypothetical protein
MCCSRGCVMLRLTPGPLPSERRTFGLQARVSSRTVYASRSTAIVTA